ncbi:decapping nuclease [Maudiozyma humilis]|uniref:Decapping nuclease n=1 Tax=Maudiozyma humilis TaxID=51915 RepID=A0AAV5RU69_MAUHU|nr:decapping nuclease [Kazachstania humilis]
MSVSASLFIGQKGSTTALKQPKELACYARNQSGETLHGAEARPRYYYLPDQSLDHPIDLTAGLRKFKDCSAAIGDRNSLHRQLQALMRLEQHKAKRVKGDIVASTDTIASLVLSAFDNEKINPIDMYVVAYDGQLFIRKAQNTAIATDKPAQMDLHRYVPYKFKSMATLAQPVQLEERATIEKRPKRLCNNGDMFASLTRAGVGKTKLLLASEIDCVFDFREEGNSNLRHYAQLVCNPTVGATGEAHKFENGIFRVWLRCFLAGVPRIICGFADDTNTLKTVEEYATVDVPVLLKEHAPEVGARCLDAIKWYGLLTEWLLKIVPPSEDAQSVKPFRLTLADNHLKLQEVESSDAVWDSIVNGEAVLSREFVEWRRSLPAK